MCLLDLRFSTDIKEERLNVIILKSWQELILHHFSEPVKAEMSKLFMLLLTFRNTSQCFVTCWKEQPDIEQFSFLFNGDAFAISKRDVRLCFTILGGEVYTMPLVSQSFY